ncbi:MAG: ribose 5-phosphate isomerase B [Planctomycetes bacterium]|nr:ribose 5-phosphate isomerase B [Planctomycetota bacterium]
MKVALAADHRGVACKKKVKEILLRLGHEPVDYGTDSTESVDYPDYALPAARAVAKGECERGVLICGSGVGMSLAANKVHGIRAALCHNEEVARASRAHNDANVLCLGADVVPESLVDKIVGAWFEARFEGGRHQRRVDKVMAAEKS